MSRAGCEWLALNMSKQFGVKKNIAHKELVVRGLQIRNT
jgi:hypothetical protein